LREFKEPGLEGFSGRPLLRADLELPQMLMRP